MLFNSYIFIFSFLPLTLFLFFLAGKLTSREASLWVLILASLFFYGYWNIHYLPLIVGSVLVNYALGQAQLRFPDAKGRLMTLAIVLNLLVLGYFKYANFFLDNMNSWVGTDYRLEKIILPLGISFFTFQQLSYQVDIFGGRIKDREFSVYTAFVLFFPQLIAGPIVRYTDVGPQLKGIERTSANPDNMNAGLFLFVLGLSKKVLLADNIEAFASPVFDLTFNGGDPALIESWVGAVLYSFQLYFDFSGYSDMAVGLAWMFNIKIPINFDSPYKAANIIDFWKRWHISLSVCFQRYLFNPIAWVLRSYKNILINHYLPFLLTMTIIGLWHGASWTCVLFGVVHGVYLAVNHHWFKLNPPKRGQVKWFRRLFAIALTFLAVVCVNVLFRSDSLTGAIDMYRGMFGFNGIVLPPVLKSLFGGAIDFGVVYSYYLFPSMHDEKTSHILMTLIFGAILVWGFKNSNHYFTAFKADKKRWVIALLLLFWCLIEMNTVSTFLYYQF